MAFGPMKLSTKQKCDALICAAKILHPALFDPTALHQIAPQGEHRLPMRRFELECEFLSTIGHQHCEHETVRVLPMACVVSLVASRSA